MNEPKTPNLGLNKIDRSSPSTTYFDLDKYLDQNWEKVDGFAEQVEGKGEETAAQVSSIQVRLDTEKRRSVTLEPGLQIINAERASAFKLEGLKGRTLVNLLGRAGGCEDLSKIGAYQSTLSLDSTNKVQGTNGLKMTIDSGTSGIGYFTVALKAGKFYVAIAEVKNGNGTSVYINLAGVGSAGNAVTDTTKFNVTWTRYTPPSDMTLNVDVGVVGTAVGQFGYADAVRLYEVSAVEYAALSNMTPEQINAKYPYVDSVQPVRNPYAIRYGENLLPPFYEWTLVRSPYVMTSPYTVTGSPTGGAAHYVEIDVIPNTDYIFSVEHNGNISVYTEDGLTAIKGYTTDQSITFNSGNNKEIRTYLNGLIAGTFTFKNPMLMIGTIAKPFKPREDAMLALQTDLYADPLTGANADEVFEKDGQYFKLTKRKKVVLDERLAYLHNGNASGFKQVQLAGPLVNARGAYSFGDYSSSIMTKCDGKVMPVSDPSLGPDNHYINSTNKYLVISVSNADSGWGDSYTPSTDEIKAYFMGWRMYDGSQTGNPYNGTGTKTWNSIKHWGTPTYYTTTLPTTQAPEWTPYQLVYQLATPTVEPITSEGQLTLIEGDNQVEVGTGIVLREKAPLVLVPGSAAAMGDIGNPSAYRIKRFIKAYKNGRHDSNWYVSTLNPYGLEKARIDWVNFDSSATYTITYLMLNTFPNAPFVGSVAENEKALLTDMNDIMRQNAAAVSVLEMSLDEAIRSLTKQIKRNVWGEIL